MSEEWSVKHAAASATACSHSGSRVRITGAPHSLSAKKVVPPLPFQKFSYKVENQPKSAIFLTKSPKIAQSSLKHFKTTPGRFDQFLSPYRHHLCHKSAKNYMNCQYFLSLAKKGVPPLLFHRKKADPPTLSYPP
jgi:hypothetical protein